MQFYIFTTLDSNLHVQFPTVTLKQLTFSDDLIKLEIIRRVLCKRQVAPKRDLEFTSEVCLKSENLSQINLIRLKKIKG